MAINPAKGTGFKPDADKNNFKMTPNQMPSYKGGADLTSPPEFAWPSQPRPQDAHPAYKKLTAGSGATRHFSK